MYSRELQSTLLELSSNWPIISVTGPRQSGKTTLCRMTFPNYEYVNLEHFPTRDRIAADIDAFLDQHQRASEPAWRGCDRVGCHLQWQQRAKHHL